MNWAIISIFVSLLSFGVAAYFYSWVSKLPSNNQKIEDIRNAY